MKISRHPSKSNFDTRFFIRFFFTLSRQKGRKMEKPIFHRVHTSVISPRLNEKTLEVTHADQLGWINGFLASMGFVQSISKSFDRSLLQHVALYFKNTKEINLENATWKLANTLTSARSVLKQQQQNNSANNNEIDLNNTAEKNMWSERRKKNAQPAKQHHHRTMKYIING